MMDASWGQAGPRPSRATSASDLSLRRASRICTVRSVETRAAAPATDPAAAVTGPASPTPGAAGPLRPTPHPGETMTHLPDAAADVRVEPGATSHRLVLKADGTRVVVFAFDEGQELREHTAPFPVLLQAIEGHLRVTAGGGTADLRPGGLVHLPARLPHSVEAAEASRMMLTMVGVA